MADELTSVEVEIERDRFGRPLVIPPEGGKPTAYTRCTTYIDVLDDKYNLQKWMQRQVALGLSARPDLRLAVAAHRDDKKTLNSLCEQALEAASSSAAATTGTALHALTEQLDRGLEPSPGLPDETLADLEAYEKATAELTHVHIERFTVLDRLKIGGTPDRVVEYGGERYIADLKTGSIEYGALKIASQLAVYSRSQLYDAATGARTIHGASLTRGIIVHAPAGQARCELHWVDLEAGWEAVKVAGQVRDQRRLRFRQLTAPFGPPPRPSLHAEKNDAAREAARVELEADRLARTICACTTPDQVRRVWAQHTEEWTDALTATAKAHIAGLPKVS